MQKKDDELETVNAKLEKKEEIQSRILENMKHKYIANGKLQKQNKKIKCEYAILKEDYDSLEVNYNYLSSANGFLEEKIESMQDFIKKQKNEIEQVNQKYDKRIEEIKSLASKIDKLKSQTKSLEAENLKANNEYKFYSEANRKLTATNLQLRNLIDSGMAYTKSKNYISKARCLDNNPNQNNKNNTGVQISQKYNYSFLGINNK